jgi:RES domain
VARLRIPAPATVPNPPPTGELDPLTIMWRAGREFFRCFDDHWGVRDFYSGDDGPPGRFHPFTPAGRKAAVKVLYGAGTLGGALSETVFHDVPIRGAKHVEYGRLRHRLLMAVAPKRDLKLVDLTSDGLSRLGLSRNELIDSDVRTYPDTAKWARALHDNDDTIDGLLWVSRLQDTSHSIVLFGDRVERDSLEVPEDTLPQILAVGSGYELACSCAARAGITIVGFN